MVGSAAFYGTDMNLITRSLADAMALTAYAIIPVIILSAWSNQ